ncbi:MAG: hypothetical protein VYE18_01470 [Pseudomonadota bacterium]|nr:hypothetical protein [Pseudomonadota bacterium]
MSCLSVACFHVTPTNPVTANTYWALFQMMAASLRRVAPGAEVHLLTLEGCAVPSALDCDMVFHHASLHSIEDSFKQLMAEETATWRAYEAAGHLQGPTILIDADLIFQRDPFALFDGGFDVGLTYVTEAELHPFNSGVILIDPGRPGLAADYLARLDNLVAGYGDAYRSWYGDQRAIAALLNNPEFPPGTDHIIDREAVGIRYRFIPAADWNYSEPLDANHRPVFAPAPSAGIVHFKGERKGVMARYATEVLGLEITEDATNPGFWLVTDQGRR